MDKKTKNFMLYFIVKAYLKEYFGWWETYATKIMERDYYELTTDILTILDQLAEVMKIEPRNGCSRSRTLWYRAQKGRI